MTLRKLMDEADSLFGPDGYRKFELMRNVARTRRCHTQMVIHPQSVGEHTFGVLSIIDLVSPECGKNVWKAALYHDAPEAITGDVPAPAKWDYPKLEEALRVVEARINVDYGLRVDLEPWEHDLVKFADMLELVWYGIEEMRMGNRNAASMVRAALHAVQTRKLASVTFRANQLFEFSMAMFESLGGETL